MTEPTGGRDAAPDAGSEQPQADRLASWKEIASYLGVAVRTAQRWERSEALPVHRHMHATLGSAYALRSEMDAWRAGRSDVPVPGRRLPPPRAIAVLPFVNLNRDTETEILADGLTEELINALTRIGDLSVAARTSAFHFKNTTADIGEIASRLGVGLVLEGTVRRADGRVRVVAQLIDPAKGYHLWSEAFESGRQDLFALQQDIAHAVAGMLRDSMTGADVKSPTRTVAAPGAYERYLEGRYHWNRRTPAGFLKAIDCFEQALVEDRGLAVAWGALAECYAFAPMVASNLSVAEGRARTEAVARGGLELDPTLAEAHVALGFLKATHDSDWNSAEEHLLRAIACKPQLVVAHQIYAGMVLLPTRRLREAEKHAARAVALDPLSPVAIIGIAMLRLMQRRYEEAAAAFRAALEIDPTFPWAHRGLGEIDLLHGRHVEAAASFARVEMPALAAGFLAFSYARLGREAEARQCLRRLQEAGQPAPWCQIAAAHLGLDDLPATLSSLERLRDERSPGFHWLGVDPFWDPLRGEPRFGRILASLGLTVGPRSSEPPAS